MPGRAELVGALAGAAATHHEYEDHTLGGERDHLWAGFYAAYVLGRLGPVAACSELVAILEGVAGEPWGEAAADAIIASLSDRG